VLSEAFVTAAWDYRRRGGRLYRLANAHGLSASTLSAILNGIRRVEDDDPRLIAIGLQLGLLPDQVFEREEVAS
jgi:hypothetical protein